jgi:hypothetical protein
MFQHLFTRRRNEEGNFIFVFVKKKNKILENIFSATEEKIENEIGFCNNKSTVKAA